MLLKKAPAYRKAEKEDFSMIDIVNIGWHIYLKDITDYAARSKDW